MKAATRQLVLFVISCFAHGYGVQIDIASNSSRSNRSKLLRRHPEAISFVDVNNTSLNVIMLTFDDGPHPKLTPRLLDLLKTYNAKATFFMQTPHIVAYPDIVSRVVSEGHEIGNHG
jgi:peptidoglycan/xylan/chitin deacetylase (PgdA/CDA1 family)